MDLFAAIDVGSNSIRLQIAAFVSGFQHQVVREERAVTRLGAGVFQDGQLTERSIKDSLDTIKSFRRKAEEAGVVAIRAVGTSALREANNGRRFLKKVKSECDVEVEIISGREEARLIHLGVISRAPQPDEPLLLIDVGGGSAEFTLSHNRKLGACSSGPLGAVRLTEMFLESDPPATAEIERLEGYIHQRLSRIKKTLGIAADGKAAKAEPLWIRVIGTSGTMAALAGATKRVGAPRSGLDGQVFEAAEIETLYRRLRTMKRKAREDVPGINARRAEIIVAGIAVVAIAMRGLEIAEIMYSDAGLRDGVLVDLAARHKGDEAGIQYLKAERLESVRELAGRYGDVRSHSEHVAKLSRQLFQALQSLHEMDEHYGEMLEAAALLHNIGHYVNPAKHHKHTYYLIANSELPGYSDRERLLVANVARYHRGSFPSPEHEGYGLLAPKDRKTVEQLAALLRLADSCDNGRRRVVHSVIATPKSDRVDVTLLASNEAELETWAAQKSAALFRHAFGRKLNVQAQMMKPASGAPASTPNK